MTINYFQEYFNYFKLNKMSCNEIDYKLLHEGIKLIHFESKKEMSKMLNNEIK